jgi:hypothetical protein
MKKKKKKRANKDNGSAGNLLFCMFCVLVFWLVLLVRDTTSWSGGPTVQGGIQTPFLFLLCAWCGNV